MPTTLWLIAPCSGQWYDIQKIDLPKPSDIGCPQKGKEWVGSRKWTNTYVENITPHYRHGNGPHYL
eukprot:9621792-Ditylum_brightwellii.AAC.1